MRTGEVNAGNLPGRSRAADRRKPLGPWRCHLREMRNVPGRWRPPGWKLGGSGVLGANTYDSWLWPVVVEDRNLGICVIRVLDIADQERGEVCDDGLRTFD